MSLLLRAGAAAGGGGGSSAAAARGLAAALLAHAPSTAWPATLCSCWSALLLPCSGGDVQARCSSSAATAAAAAAGAGQRSRGKQRAAAEPAVAHKQQQQQQHDEQALAALAAVYQRARLQTFYDAHLARELLLKLNLGSVHELPKLRSIDLSISAKDLLGRRYAEKWEMLLPALGLEYITGRPAAFVCSGLKYYRARNAITAVKVRVTGGAALDVLQKLVYVVLPSQNAFAGVPARALDHAGNMHFRVQRMINFPDFEEQFEIFENLTSLHVSLNLANVAKHRARARLLLSGLQLPVLEKRGAQADAAPEAESGGNDSGSESESDGALSAADD